MAKTSAPCRGCGADIPRASKTGPIRHYCSSDCRPRCEVDGCEKPRHGDIYCSAHHTRWMRHGDPLAPLLRTPNEGLLCTVEGCGQPRRKRTWCAAHYAQWRRAGEVRPFTYKWADDLTCILCGKPSGVVKGMRRFCSDRCQQHWHRHGGVVSGITSCVGCGVDIDLTVTGKSGRRRRADIKLCRRCRQDKRKHGISVQFLAVRDGIECGICLSPVDMTLRYPHPGTPSVDHTIPRACGGTNDPDNLQLAHLWCNQVKADSM